MFFRILANSKMTNQIFPFRLLICLCLLLFVLKSNSQTNGSALNNTYVSSYLDSKKILGIWSLVDSIGYDIEFIDSGYEIELKSNYSHKYYFSKDSTGHMSSSGYYPQWPPPGCDLVLISNDTLKITYSPFFEPGPSFFYVKKNRLIKKK